MFVSWSLLSSSYFSLSILPPGADRSLAELQHSSSSFSLSPLRLQVLIFLQFITLASTGTYLPSVYHPCVYRYLSSFSSSPLRLQVLIFLQFITLASRGTHLPSIYHPCVYKYLSSFSSSPLRLQVFIFLQFMTLASTGIRLPSVYHFCPLFSQASLNIKGQLKIKIIIF